MSHRHSYLDGNPCKCGRVKDLAAAARGRRNNRRGKAHERAAVKALGAKRVGQFGGKEDGLSNRWAIQSKSKAGRAFPSWMAAELEALFTFHGAQRQWPVLLITEAPGPGKKARRLAVMWTEDLAEINDLLGPEPENPIPDKEAA